MDYNSFIKGRGYKEVYNPDYNPKDKNSTEPKTKQILESQANKTALDEALEHERSRGYSIKSKDIEKYNREGFNYNKWENFDLMLAQNQSVFSKFSNAVAQTLVSELGLGIIKGFSDLTDMVGQAFGVSDHDYSNPFSAKIEEWQEKFRNDIAPIYTTPGVNIQNGGLADAGWWASNIPSVISSLTLLVPGTTVVKGASWLGKATKLNTIGKKAAKVLSGAKTRAANVQKAIAEGKSAEEIAEISKAKGIQKLFTPGAINTGKLLAENTSMAVMSRAMENYQEARQTYNDMYLEANNKLKNMSDDEYAKFIEDNKETFSDIEGNANNRTDAAKHIARKAADRTFAIDWSNVVFDVAEMYALRGAWKGVKNAPNISASVRRANLDAAKYAGKSPEEIAQIRSKMTFKQKAKEKISDIAHTSAMTVGAELSEGVEEAVNYIASQEGMYYGKSLLKDKDIENNWQTRLKTYLNSPELMESAFWGVLGGVVFQAGGSKLNDIKHNLSKKDSEAGQDVSRIKLGHNELPENERMIATIEANQMDFITYHENLEKINNNIDVYRSTSDNEVKFDSEEEKELAKDKLTKGYLSEMALRSMNNGTLDLLKAYIEDDNVATMLLGENTSREDRKAYQKELLDIVNNVERNYDDELLMLDSIAYTDSNEEADYTIPVEYLQILATRNVKTRAIINDLNKQKPVIDDRIAKLSQQLIDDGKLSNSITYEDSIRLSTVAANLARLRADLRNVVNGNMNELDKSIAKRNIQSKIEGLERNLKQEELAFVTAQSLAFSFNKDGALELNVNNFVKDTLGYLSAIKNKNKKEGEIVDFKSEIELSEKHRRKLSDKEAGALDLITDNYKYAMHNTDSKLSNISPELNKLYTQKAQIDINIRNLKEELVNTPTSLKTEVGVIHNTLDNARKAAIESANQTIASVYKNKKEDVRNYILAKYNNESNIETGSLTKEEIDGIDQAIKILDFGKVYNKGLINGLSEVFNQIDRDEEKQQAGTEESNATNVEPSNAVNKSNATNSQVNSANNNQLPNNPSTNNTNSQNQSKTGQISQNPDQTTPKQININFDTKDITDDDKSAITITPATADTYTVSTTEDNLDKLIHNSDLFINDDIDLTRPHKVVKDPIISIENGKYKIIEKGELAYTDNGEAEAKEQEIAAQQAAQQQQSQEPQPGANNAKTADDMLAKMAQQSSVTNQTPINEKDEQILATGVQQANKNETTTRDDTKVLSETDRALIEDELQNIPGQIQQDILKEVKAKVPKSVDDSASAKTAVNQARIEELKRIIANKKEYAKKYRELYIQQYKDKVDSSTIESLINEALDSRLTSLIKALERKIAADNKAQSAISEMFISNFNLGDYLQATTKSKDASIADAIKAFKDAVDNFIMIYADSRGIEPINGKYYVNLENMLRFINETIEDNFTSQFLFNSIKAYLTSDNKDSRFIITDKNDFNNKDFLDNVNKSEEIRNEERRKEFLSADVDIDIFTHISMLPEAEQDKFRDAFNKLNPGDKLSIRVGKRNGGDILEFVGPDNLVIGTIPVPHIEKGFYTITNEHWKTDVRVEANDVVHSNLKELFLTWIRPKTDAAKELSAAIMEMAYEGVTEDRLQEILKQLSKNTEILNAKRKGFIGKTVDLNDLNNIQILANHLIKLWKYANVEGLSSSNKVIRASSRERLEESVNDWFLKLNKSYTTAHEVARDAANGYEAIVKDLNEGELIKAAENATYEDCPSAKNALALGLNSKVYHIGSCMSDNAITFSGETTYNLKGMKNHGTAVRIPNRNTKGITYASVFEMHVNDPEVSDEFKNIVTAIQEHIGELIDNFATDRDTETFDRLFNFFVLAFHQYGSNSSLFHGARAVTSKDGSNKTLGTKDGNGTAISFFMSNGVTNGNVRIYTKNKALLEKGGITPTGEKQAITINLTDKDHVALLKEAVKDIMNNINVNLNNNYILADNNKTTQLQGLAKYEDGRFVIRVGNNSWSYDSFNDFIISNNLIRCNTRPSSDGKSNFAPKAAKNMKADAKLKVDIVSKPSTPVEKTQQSTTAPVTSTPSTVPVSTEKAAELSQQERESKLNAILDKATKNQPNGEELIEFLAEDNKALLNSLKGLDLIPKIITFDKELNADNNYVNAATDKLTKVARVGTRFQAFSTSNDPKLRKQALRKIIHEGFHNRIRLDKDPVLKKNIESIFNQFKEYLASDAIKTNPTVTSIAKEYNKSIDIVIQHFNTYKFDDYINNGKYDEALEEFIVEALTSSEIAALLNTITTKDKIKANKKAKSLLERLIDCLLRLLNIKPNENNNSLYEDAVTAIANHLTRGFKDNTNSNKSKSKVKAANKKSSIENDGQYVLNFGQPATTEKDTQDPIVEQIEQVAVVLDAASTEPSIDSDAVKEAKAKVEQIIEDGSKVKLSDNEKYYVNPETGQTYSRVTTAIGTDVTTLTTEDGLPINPDNLDEVLNSVNHPFDPNSPWATPSTNVGTGVDEFVRDFFLGALDDLDPIELGEKYPNATGIDLEQFKNDLISFKESLETGKLIPGKNITIVSRDVKAQGVVNVLMPDGTTKQLNINGTLDLFGYDQNGEFYIFDMKTMHSYNNSNIHRNTPKWRKQLSLYKTFLETKYGIKVNSCGIIPIAVNYPDPTKGAEYTVANPEKHNDYNDPNRCQLLIKDKDESKSREFKEASPRLKPLIPIEPTGLSTYSYKHMDNYAKSLVNGKPLMSEAEANQFVDPYDKTKQEVKQEETKPVEEVKPTSKIYGDVKQNITTNRRRGILGRGTRSTRSELSYSTRSEINGLSETEQIKQKALANGTFMKAPNGKVSNLNEQQWLQVRTKAFKDWFGDWENDIENSSKVVDENGEPLVVYHGTNKTFDTFESDKNGIYFTTDNDYASDISLDRYWNSKSSEKPSIQPVFLNIKNILTGDKLKDIADTTEDSNLLENGNLTEHNVITFGYGNVERLRKNEAIQKFDGIVGHDYAYGFDSYREIDEDTYNDSEDDGYYSYRKIDNKYYQSSSYNAASFGKEYVVFNPNQVKSATDNTGEFSSSDNNIYHSTRSELFTSSSPEAFSRNLPSKARFNFMTSIVDDTISTMCK